LLTNEFENIVCAIEEPKDLPMLLVEELIRLLEAHGQQRRKKKEESLNQALLTNVTIKGKARNIQRGG